MILKDWRKPIALPKKIWPQPVVRIRTTYRKTSYVQIEEWLDEGCKLLRDMRADGWPRRAHISRSRIAGEAGKSERSLRAQDIRTIRREYKRTAWNRSNVLELAAKYGTTRGAIASVVARRTWRYEEL